jgi:hypothetical protein
LGIFFRGREEVVIPGVVVAFVQTPMKENLKVLIVGQGLIIL